MNKGFIDSLYYGVGKQADLKLAIAYKDNEGNVKWSKHLSYLDAQKDEQFMQEVNNRTTLPCEIVFDYDPKKGEDTESFKKRVQEKISQLKSDGYKFSAYFTGSRGYHIHLFFNGLAELEPVKRKHVKQLFIQKYEAETLKASEGTMIALEGAPHWKTGQPKTLIEEVQGNNASDQLIREYSSESNFKNKVVSLLSQRGGFADAIQETAEYFSNTEYIITLQDTEEVYIYCAGVYVPDGQKTISAKIEAILKEHCNTRFVNELLNKLKRMTFVARKDCNEPLMKICLANGILNLETMQVEPHNPDEPFFNKLPVTYDSAADCPRIKKFIAEVVPADMISVLQEVIGYCLYKAYPVHKAIMLVGVGANGKSSFIGLLKAFLGAENCASIPLQQLELNRFAASALHGKLANLYADLPASALKETSHFKMLTGQDLVDAERKFKDKFSFQNYSKQVFSANKVPQSPDDSDAFFRRWVIITFPNQFVGVADDKNLSQKIATADELSGLLNWAIEGLKRLLAQGDFSNAKSIQEVRETYIRMSDSVAAFALDCIVVGSEVYVPKKELYTAYTDYCRARNYPAVAENTFHRDLQKQVRVEDYYPKLEEGRVKCWKGVKVQSRGILNGEKGSQPSQPSHDVKTSGQNVNPVNDVKVFPNLRDHSKAFFEQIKTIVETLAISDPLVDRLELDNAAVRNGISVEQVSTWVDQAKNKGDIYEPKPGFLALVNPAAEVLDGG